MATHKDPLNIAILDVNKLIKERGCKEVTSPFIHESSTNEMHKEGLFSEEIFGAIATEERMLHHGYISLHCRVFHPVIFQNLKALKRFYVEIMSGKSFAIWDKTEKDFFAAAEEDEGADTGFSFFLKHFNEINFKKNLSLKRNDKINVIIKYAKLALIDKCIVIPAGLRDFREEDGRLEKDSINTLYLSLLSSAKAMPQHGDLDPIYDTVHYSVQRKVVEIYEFLSNWVEGKRGFLQGKLAHRHIAGGTRNVITATNLESSDPTSPQFHKSDEVKVPLFQAAKGYAPIVPYHLKLLFYSNVINQSADSVSLIDPNTLELSYLPIDDQDKDALLTDEGIQKTIDRFRDNDFRFKPVTVRSKGKPYFLYLVYDAKDKIYIFRNLGEFKMDYGEKFNANNVRPLTYCEMLYIATYFASKDKFGTITRYPVTNQESIFVARTHLMSTTPGRIVTLVSNAATGAGTLLPEYPIMGEHVDDVLRFHPSKRAGLGADFDGDTVSWIPIYGKEANEECEKYVNSPQEFILPSGKSQLGTDDLCSISCFSLTKEPARIPGVK